MTNDMVTWHVTYEASENADHLNGRAIHRHTDSASKEVRDMLSLFHYLLVNCLNILFKKLKRRVL